MKWFLWVFLAAMGSSAWADAPDVGIPQREADLIKATDKVDVSGTNDLGGAEAFTIHNSKAIAQFVALLTSDRYVAVPKSLQPKFKSLSFYQVRLSAHGSVVLEFRIVADSILDLPGENFFYMQSDRHSDNLLAPLLRLR